VGPSNGQQAGSVVPAFLAEPSGLPGPAALETAHHELSTNAPTLIGRPETLVRRNYKRTFHRIQSTMRSHKDRDFGENIDRLCMSATQGDCHEGDAESAPMMAAATISRPRQLLPAIRQLKLRAVNPYLQWSHHPRLLCTTTTLTHIPRMPKHALSLA
jgi:hypothetical protein